MNLIVFTKGNCKRSGKRNEQADFMFPFFICIFEISIDFWIK